MRALKIIVVVLGVALVAGTVALVALIATRLQHHPAPPPETAAPQPPRWTLPAGSHIVSTELSGDRLLIRVALGDGGEELVLVNARDGVEVAVIALPAAH